MKKSNAKGTNYLMIDIKNDLKNIDSFMTKIITDKKLKERFFKNPSKVAIELGLHPPTTKIAIGISNRIFYATLSNKKLMQHVMQNIPKVKIDPSFQKKAISNLKKGIIQNDIRVDEIYLQAYFENTSFLRKLFQLSLYDLNKKGILQKKFKETEIDNYIEKVIEFIGTKKGLKELPGLVKFGPNYGIGVLIGDEDSEAGSDTDSDIGSEVLSDTGSEADSDTGSNAFVFSEVAGVATILIPVEGIAVATVLIPVVAFGMGEVEVDGYVDPENNQGIIGSYNNVLELSKDGIRAIQTIEKMLSFASDLALFIKNNENYFGKEN